jgi:hypothetical protein
MSVIQHYLMKLVSDLRQVGGFSPGTPVSSTNKTDCHDITELLLKVALSTKTKPIHFAMNRVRIYIFSPTTI